MYVCMSNIVILTKTKDFVQRFQQIMTLLWLTRLKLGKAIQVMFCPGQAGLIHFINSSKCSYLHYHEGTLYLHRQPCFLSLSLRLLYLHTIQLSIVTYTGSSPYR